MRGAPAGLMVLLLVCACTEDEREREVTEVPGVSFETRTPSPNSKSIDPHDYSFRVLGDETGSKIMVRRIEIRRASDDGLVQAIDDIETDTPIRNGASSLEFLDMNFDAFNDFRVIEFVAAGPNISYLNWLYDSGSQQYVRAEELDTIPSATYDSDAKRIRSTWRDNASRYGVDTYEWIDGRPELMRKESREYTEPGVYKRIISEFVGGKWMEAASETIRE